MTTRARYHHGDLRTALLDAAEDLLAERGLAGFTLRECARRAGVSHAAPAHHFGSVGGLFTALATRGFERLVESVRQSRAAAPAEDLDAQLAATMRAYVGYARREPELFRLMFRHDVLVDDGALRVAAEATYAELTNVIRAQRGEAPIGPAELELLKTTAGLVEDILVGWCHIHGLAHLLIEGQLDVMTGGDEDAFLDRVIAANAPRIGRPLRD